MIKVNKKERTYYGLVKQLYTSSYNN